MSSPPTFPGKENMSGPCTVCDKPGHGVHYGAWTCDSCKCFFARSSRRGSETLVCNINSKCDLSGKEPRMICKYCRFQKCLKVGMKLYTAHRYAPFPQDNQVRRSITPNNMVTQSPSPSSSVQSLETTEIDNVPLSEPFDIQKLIDQLEINNIVDSYREGCCFTVDKIKNVEVKEFEVPTSRNAEIARDKAWTDYAKEYEADIKALIPFIDDLQDSFDSLDKAILLKGCAFQIYFLRRVRALNPYGLLLSDGRVIKMNELQLLYGAPLVIEMLQVVNRILQIGFTDEDIALFIPVIYYDKTNLVDLKLRNQENLSTTSVKFRKLFVMHSEARCADERVFAELVKLRPDLQKLKAKHQQCLEFLKPYRWAFPETSLFAEVYGLDPKIVPIQNESNSPSSSTVSNGSL
ncbi:hypothetical protein CAEBREN_08684 [Caenorhabditis brenneri]|uniref:Nuclear receptor domain-containing protein n=1 Tax=Caenorhabditis brenneri TaxID=135651 RepID=G0NS23_CAEBE|nr:hypothetical protein CAEBREN_08684 [Caenorhabditis brenneri]